MNINEATREQLQQAFQVDGERAEYLVRKRQQLGGFSSWDQIRDAVPSFDEKMVENLRTAGLTLGPAHHGERRREQGGGDSQSHPSGAERGGGKLDINSASAEELKHAFQVDGQRAAYIMKKREQLGGFSSWEQFKNEVPGFENKMVENLEAAGFSWADAKQPDVQVKRWTAQQHTKPRRKNMPGAIGDASSVDLNSASEQELERVGGLGRERAQRIVRARPLKSWDDLRNIEGFSEKLVSDLQQAGATIGGKRAA